MKKDHKRLYHSYVYHPGFILELTFCGPSGPLSEILDDMFIRKGAPRYWGCFLIIGGDF